jgi:exodeoxyribonuclease X
MSLGCARALQRLPRFPIEATRGGMSEPIIRVIDFETTGEDPANSDVIEVGWCDVMPNGTVVHAWSMLVKPTRPIEVEAMAVHHLTDADVAGGHSTAEWQAALLEGDPVALVAHRSSFEASFWPNCPLPWICTYKSALRIWPDAPRHSNQVLRYWLGLDLDPHLAMPPHRAGPDAYVTAHIFARMLEHEGENRLRRMLAWTREPGLLPGINFGKHKGQGWQQPPADYLTWLIHKSDMDEDVKFTAQHELMRRRGAPLL